MPKRRNPGAGKLQGFGIDRVCDKPIHTVACIDVQPTIVAAEWLARRARVSIETARVFAELHRFGGANG